MRLRRHQFEGLAKNFGEMGLEEVSYHMGSAPHIPLKKNAYVLVVYGKH